MHLYFGNGSKAKSTSCSPETIVCHCFNCYCFIFVRNFSFRHDSLSCPCVTCEPTCQYPCSTTSYCQAININFICQNGCCTVITFSTSPNPLCDGREASAGYCHVGGVCSVGFTCTPNNVCCRCAYGTSIGPCVNLNCPENFQCNANNECCPYQVGK
uniref:CC domain-containing protein n=1 Tax=Angiostrongylus cantonensis TaxID=6313 RepID=A0A0K0CVI7_ANGCA